MSPFARTRLPKQGGPVLSLSYETTPELILIASDIDYPTGMGNPDVALNTSSLSLRVLGKQIAACMCRDY